ncbi:hypothetical protein TNCV_2333851 [Trichonephila clavipes]|nr:hypothetical protein TNCV_2333851 [Trichonephila clavipes]
MGSLVVRASDCRPEGLDSMPHAAKYHSSTHEYVLVKSVCPKVLWAESSGKWRIFPSPSVPCLICGGGDRGGAAIYRPFGEFHELIRTVICMVLKANDRRTSSPLP